jgi:hypothetical protein
LELLANVWHAWWREKLRGRGDVRLDAAEISNAMTSRGSQAAISCDGVMLSFLPTLLAVLCSFLPRIKSVVFRRL